MTRWCATRNLRHTCAPLAIKVGTIIKVVQKLLGHKSAVLTLDRYGHLFPDDLDVVATAFDSAAEGRTSERKQAPSKGVLTSVAGTGFEPV